MGLVAFSDDNKRTYRPLTEAEKNVQCRVKAMFERGPYSQIELARLTDIDQSQLSKMLKGKLPFQQNHLAKIAPLYHYSVHELLFGKKEVPICAEVSAMEGFHYLLTEEKEGALGQAALPAGVDSEDDSIYCLKMGPDFQPLFPENVLLFVEKGAGSKIKDGYWGIFIDEKGIGNLRRVVFLADGMNILLESIIPGLIKSQTKPKSYLRSMDQVIYIKFV